MLELLLNSFQGGLIEALLLPYNPVCRRSGGLPWWRTWTVRGRGEVASAPHWVRNGKAVCSNTDFCSASVLKIVLRSVLRHGGSVVYPEKPGLLWGLMWSKVSSGNNWTPWLPPRGAGCCMSTDFELKGAWCHQC